MLEGKMQFAFGWTMATTKRRLSEIGGWEAMANHHSDDFELGNRIAGGPWLYRGIDSQAGMDGVSERDDRAIFFGTNCVGRSV